MINLQILSAGEIIRTVSGLRQREARELYWQYGNAGFGVKLFEGENEILPHSDRHQIITRGKIAD